jgi:hypothetical protein
VGRNLNVRQVLRLALTLLILSLAGAAAQARPPASADVKSALPAALFTTAYCQVEHNVGNLNLTVTNYGITGRGRTQAVEADCFTGLPIHSWEFPSGTGTSYLYSSCYWVGAVVGEDTLVSTGYEPQNYGRFEWHPEESPEGDIVYRTVSDPSLPASDSAVSEQDYVSVFYDTCVQCAGFASDDGTAHRPLGLEITQRTYSWSYAHTEDFVLFDCKIKNIGTASLKDVYVGQFVDGDVSHLDAPDGYDDDITGFAPTVPATFPPDRCAGGDSVKVAWIADNNGDLTGIYPPAPAVLGMRLLYSPKDSLHLSYNWWVGYFSTVDFGPQARASFRDFQTGGIGVPLGDRNRYHIMRNREIDYDQYYTSSIRLDDPVWLPPDQSIDDQVTSGLDTRFALSVGPFQLEPGEEIPFAYACVAGDRFHWNASNFKNLPRFPNSFRGNLDFSDLIHNALWAGWVYDNPGVDTDNDGYAGEFRECDGDIFWYQGDGVPDFRAVEPPVAPLTWLEPVAGGLRLRWNGHAPETTKDFLHRESRFEGYNVYIAHDPPTSGHVKLASYDVEDFYKYVWEAEIEDWRLTANRFTVEELRCLYAADSCADSNWFPQDYSRSTPFIWPEHPDSVFYFEPINANASRFALETPFVKRFPYAPKPAFGSVSEVPPDSADLYLTDDGYFKYYEYEYTLTDLLPGEVYSLSVTTFDYGSFVLGTAPLESAVTANSLTGVPLEGTLICCVGSVGNVDCDLEDKVDIGDLQRLIDHMFLTLEPLCCVEEADLDRLNGINVLDLQLMIDHLLLTLSPLGPCPAQ